MAEYANISKNVLKTRYSALLESTAQGPQLEPATNTKGTSAELHSVPPGKPLLLLGDVGVGKSLFLNHFIKIDAADLQKSTIFLRIDLLKMPSVRVDDLWNHVATETREQLANVHSIYVDDDDFVRQVYFRELERFARTPDGRLADVDEAAYLKARAAHLKELTGDKLRHLQSSMKAIQKGRKRQVTLVLDNIDHHVQEFQEEVFRIAEYIADAWGITVFVAMRPSTFYESKRQGAIAAYQPRAFTISPPRVSDVISKRLDYIWKLIGRRRRPCTS